MSPAPALSVRSTFSLQAANFSRPLIRQAQRLYYGGAVRMWHPSLGEWLVRSEINPNTIHFVNLSTRSCPCPEHVAGLDCPHLLAALKAERRYQQRTTQA